LRERGERIGGVGTVSLEATDVGDVLDDDRAGGDESSGLGEAAVGIGTQQSDELVLLSDLHPASVRTAALGHGCEVGRAWGSRVLPRRRTVAVADAVHRCCPLSTSLWIQSVEVIVISTR